MTFEEWHAREHENWCGDVRRDEWTVSEWIARQAWDAGRRQALIEAAEAVQLTAMKTIAPPLDTADCALVDAIRTAIRNL